MQSLLAAAAASPPPPTQEAASVLYRDAIFDFVRNQARAAFCAAAAVEGLEATLRYDLNADGLTGAFSQALFQKDTGKPGEFWHDAEAEARTGVATVGRRPGWLLALGLTQPVQARRAAEAGAASAARAAAGARAAHAAAAAATAAAAPDAASVVARIAIEQRAAGLDELAARFAALVSQLRSLKEAAESIMPRSTSGLLPS